MGQLELWQSPWDHEENWDKGTANTLGKAQDKDERNHVGITKLAFLNLGMPLRAGFFHEN